MKEAKIECTARSLCKGLLLTTSTNPDTNQLGPSAPQQQHPLAGGARGVKGLLNICLFA